MLQRKTDRPVQFELTDLIRTSVAGRAEYVAPLSTRQYARNVSSWVTAIVLDRRRYGTHSMRGTKASPIHRRTKNPRAVQILPGHTKLERTVRYLAIEVEGALEMAEQTEAQPASRPRSAFALGPEAASDPKPTSAQTAPIDAWKRQARLG